jgi:hypothetical protein
VAATTVPTTASAQSEEQATGDSGDLEATRSVDARDQRVVLDQRGGVAVDPRPTTSVDVTPANAGEEPGDDDRETSRGAESTIVVGHTGRDMGPLVDPRLAETVITEISSASLDDATELLEPLEDLAQVAQRAAERSAPANSAGNIAASADSAATVERAAASDPSTEEAQSESPENPTPKKDEQEAKSDDKSERVRTGNTELLGEISELIGDHFGPLSR